MSHHCLQQVRQKMRSDSFFPLTMACHLAFDARPNAI